MASTTSSKGRGRARRSAKDVAGGGSSRKALPICKWVRLARERQQRDLKGQARIGKSGKVLSIGNGLWFDKAAADHAVAWFPKLRHYKDPFAGQSFELQPWQEHDVIRVLFGWKVVKPGLAVRLWPRRFRDSYICIGKKQGKSTLLGGVADYLAFADGEAGAEVYCVATKRDQALIVHNDARELLRQSPVWKKITYHRTVHNLAIVSKAQLLRPLGHDADSNDGLNPHGLIFDEFHRYKDRRNVDTLQKSTVARRQSLTIKITTAGDDSHSPCFDEQRYAEQVLDRVIEDDRFFSYICTLDEGDDWTDERVWPKANPSLGVAVSIEDLRAFRDKALNLPAEENSFRRFHCNQWVEQASRWIPLHLWKANTRAVNPAALAGKPCFGGLDLSSKIDLTAFVLVFPKEDGSYDVLCWFWLPEDSLRDDGPRSPKERDLLRRWVRENYIKTTSGNVVDQDFIEKQVISLADKYEIGEIAFDRWGANQITTHFMNEGLQMVQFGQGYASMSEPAKTFEALVLSKKLNHGNNPVLTWMVDNVAVEMDPAGNVKPDKAKSGSRIDGVVATIMALGRAIVIDPAKLGPSVYNERGIIIM